LTRSNRHAENNQCKERACGALKAITPRRLARKALIPLENKRNFLEVSGDIVERVDPVFFSDPMTAAIKALGMA